MQVLSVTQKGGTGKTMLTVNLGVLAHQQGLKTCLIDLDPQQSVIGWYESRAAEKPDVLNNDQVGTNLLPVLERLEGVGYDLVLIDTPGVDSHATRGAMEAADLCLIPVRPSAVDLRATIPTISALMDMKRKFGFVLNQAPANKHARLTMAVVRRFENDAPVAPVALAIRIDHSYSFGLGQGITEYAPSSKGALEITELWGWCRKQMGSKKMELGHGQDAA